MQQVAQQHLASPAIFCILPLQVRFALVRIALCTMVLAACAGWLPWELHHVLRRLCARRLYERQMMSTFGVQDWLALLPQYYTRPAEEDTINDPTNPRHYWRWRMQPRVEDLLADQELVALIQTLNQAAGRASRAELRQAH